MWFSKNKNVIILSIILQPVIKQNHCLSELHILKRILQILRLKGGESPTELFRVFYYSPWSLTFAGCHLVLRERIHQLFPFHLEVSAFVGWREDILLLTSNSFILQQKFYSVCKAVALPVWCQRAPRCPPSFLSPVFFFSKASFPQSREPALTFLHLTGISCVSEEPWRPHHLCVCRKHPIRNSCLYLRRMVTLQPPNIL